MKEDNVLLPYFYYHRYRGRSLETGMLLYGSLIVHNNRVYIYEIQEDIDNAETWNFYIKLRAREVDPASVNRCVATDIDNIPVYEKDNVECYTVTCEDEDNVMVHLVDTKIVGIDGANILISEYSHFKKIEGK